MSRTYPASHAAPTRRGRKAARRSVSVTGVSVVAVVGLLAGVAVAAVFARANINGQVNRGAYAVEWSANTVPLAAVVDADTGASIQTLSQPTYSGAELTLSSAPTVFVGEALRVTGGVKLSTSGKDGYISGLMATGIPAGWTVRLSAGCGVKVTTSTTSPNVGVEIVPTSTAAPSPLDLSAVALGVKVSGLNSGATPPAGVVCAPIVGA